MNYPILASHIKPSLIPIQYGGNAAAFYNENSRILLSRKTTSLYAKLPNWVTGVNKHADNGMYVLRDSYNTQHVTSDELLYDITANKPKFIKNLTTNTTPDWGYEDPRIVSWNDKTIVLMSKRNTVHPRLVDMFYGTISSDYNLTNITPVKGHLQVEKNWSPITNQPGMCLYTLNPLTIVNIFTNKFTSITSKPLPDLRGSSNIIKCKDGYYALMHSRTDDFQYIHYFVKFDNKLNVTQISQPFSFWGMNVEFSCYMEYQEDANAFHILVSIHEHLLFQFSVEMSMVEKLLSHSFNGEVKYQYLFDLYSNATSINNIPAAIAIASYSSDKRILSHALPVNHDFNRFIALHQTYIEAQMLDNFFQKA